MNNLVSIVIPVFGQYQYACKAIATALINSHTKPLLILIDDASSDLNYKENLTNLINNHKESIIYKCFTINQGYIHACNVGLNISREHNYKYTIIANSDLLFPFNWDLHLLSALENGYHLVGPMTNAPGTCDQQDITTLIKDYTLTDDITYINKISKQLQETYNNKVINSNINGFLMAAKTETWHKYSYSPDMVFNPYNKYNSKGQLNSSPRMTLSESEIQGRWSKSNLKIGIVLGSFVFHYRSVSRGDKYKKKGWYRIKQDS